MSILHKIKLSFGVVAADDVTIEGDTLSVAVGNKTLTMPLEDALADKCKACRHPNPVVYDHLVGEPVEPWNEEFVPSPRLQELLTKTEDERNAYWQDQMSPLCTLLRLPQTPVPCASAATTVSLKAANRTGRARRQACAKSGCSR